MMAIALKRAVMPCIAILWHRWYRGTYPALKADTGAHKAKYQYDNKNSRSLKTSAKIYELLLTEQFLLTIIEGNVSKKTKLSPLSPL